MSSSIYPTINGDGPPDEGQEGKAISSATTIAARSRTTDETEAGIERARISSGKQARTQGRAHHRRRSGIGRAVAVAFAKEGADVAIVYLEEHEDARETKRLVEAEGRRCILISGAVGDEEFCNSVVEETLKKLQRLNISTFPEDHIESFGAKVPMNRAGQPDECAPSYVFLASDDAAYMTGQVLHRNGGEVING
jgi:enoyl-[acyl-carrier-protein] reductase (NADH)